MAAADLTRHSLGEILRLHGAIGSELKRRGISRTGNNPCADFAEHLCCATFGWQQNDNSRAGFDALALDGTRFEIKARRLSRPGASRQVSALRNLAKKPFDRLVGIVFSAEYHVLLGLDIPYDVVVARSTHVEHTNSGRFFLRDDLLLATGVKDVTAILQAAAMEAFGGDG